MNDKDWLLRVKVAAAVFKETEFCVEPDEIDNFIHWLYQQYGIVEPKDQK